MRRVELLILLFGALALFLDPLSGPAPVPLPIEPAAPGGASDGFAPGSVYPSTDPAGLPAGLSAVGSWNGRDAATGSYRSPWYRAARPMALSVSGYPTLPGNRLEVCLRRADGAETHLVYAGANPGEAWRQWRIAAPASVQLLQIRAVDHRTAFRGWLGVSQPYQPADYGAGGTLLAALKLAATAALALSLLWAPGLILSPSRLPVALLPGPVTLAAFGCLIWAADGVSSAWVARVLVGGLLGVLIVHRLRSKRAWSSPELRLPLAGAALLAGFAISRADYSAGAPGELYGGTISRTLEVGPHSDSRISYHVAQVAAHHWGPWSAPARQLFAPYSFGTRGPLAGWIAAPLILATGGEPPRGLPDETWSPFDPQGFVTYRIAMIALASLAAWAVWGLMRATCSRSAADLSLVLLLLTPFYAHELYFTWPKLISAALVVTSFYFLHCERRSGLAGLALGGAYLFHPAALLSAPFLGLWVIGDFRRGPALRRLGQAALLAAASLAVVAPWALFGRTDPSGVNQAVFLDYFHSADGSPATWASWWHTRLEDLANTFLPGYAALFHSDHWTLNAVDGPSGTAVHLSLLYWVSFPFAVGLVLLGIVVAALAALARRRWRIVLVLLILPAIWLDAYWGAAPTGLMRQCGHVLFLTAIMATAWTLDPAGLGQLPRLRRLVQARWFNACRAAEVFLMAFGATFAGGWPKTSPYLGNDLLALTAAGCCLAALVRLSAETETRRYPYPGGAPGSPPARTMDWPGAASAGP